MQGADTGGLALTAPELLAAAARARPASAKRGSHDPSEQVRVFLCTLSHILLKCTWACGHASPTM